MATDLESGIQQDETAPTRPSLKIVGLHVRGLKSITSLDLPQDGLGWDGPIPDFIMVGGVNGCGKTTLLEFLANILDQRVPPSWVATNAWVDFEFHSLNGTSTLFRYIAGDTNFVEIHSQNCEYFGYEINRTNSHSIQTIPLGYYLDSQIIDLIRPENAQFSHDAPAVVYFPSESRNLFVPETSYFYCIGALTERKPFCKDLLCHLGD